MGVTILLLDSQMVIVGMNEWDVVHLRVGTHTLPGVQEYGVLGHPPDGAFLVDGKV